MGEQIRVAVVEIATSILEAGTCTAAACVDSPATETELQTLPASDQPSRSCHHLYPSTHPR